jgi:NAD+ diphosphatase
VRRVFRLFSLLSSLFALSLRIVSMPFTDSADAQWFPRSQLAALIADPSGSYLSRDDHKKLEQKGLSEQELANALAPAEGKPDGVAHGPLEGLTRVPPATAIAGQLIRVWAEGRLELVSKL